MVHRSPNERRPLTALDRSGSIVASPSGSSEGTSARAGSSRDRHNNDAALGAPGSDGPGTRPGAGRLAEEAQAGPSCVCMNALACAVQRASRAPSLSSRDPWPTTSRTALCDCGRRAFGRRDRVGSHSRQPRFRWVRTVAPWSSGRSAAVLVRRWSLMVRLGREPGYRAAILQVLCRLRASNVVRVSPSDSLSALV